ncbi:hypothetical protein V5O48_015958 [Marasmius crinis-equi]|uniref:CxC6 like cysteine cluster associated with KDZ domain-containing protein n=1 Tax=Marasmius crinis-equi TaxID=585013 RepID=A0ABR3ETF9_9AGAR
MRITRHLKHEISFYSMPSSGAGPPAQLPAHVTAFLAYTFKPLSLADVHSLWTQLKDRIWEDPERALDDEEMGFFVEYMQEEMKEKHRLASSMYYPPCRECTECRRPIDKQTISRVRVTNFTLSGPEYAYSTSFRCLVCQIRFYPQYFVKGTHRFYYSPEIPSYIHFEQHAYISQKLCQIITAWMVLAWVSSQNSAAIYNGAMSSIELQDFRHDSAFSLRSIQIWRAFVLNALLRDCSEIGQALVLTENLEHDQRLKEAQCVRNERMDRHGQPERLHACAICERFIPTDLPGAFKGLRPLRAVVTDGVTIGRPCCKVHNCDKPLINNRAHFCHIHYASEKDKCVVVDCNNRARPSCKTCTMDSHKAMEDYHKLKGKGFFLLKKRLERVGVGSSQARDSFGSSETLSDDDEDLEDPAHKSDSGNQNVRARFARRRTHNEQLVVASCGVITGRATMFGAEAISGVKDFLKAVYPNRDELPDVIFHDNNCSLQSHLIAQHDDYFRNVILPVDVFHFKSKHKVTDEFCQKHCNPAQWSELVGDDGSWLFNSSIAEQTNSWIVGYQAIVRDMLPHNFDFFLDEMIKQRNELLIRRLWLAGKTPYRVPSAAKMQ